MIKMYQTMDRTYHKRAKVRTDEQLFVSVSDGKLTGYCKFRTAEDRVLLLDLYEADDDLVMADALVRATAAAFRDKYPYVEITDGGLLPAYRRHSGLYTNNKRERIENVLRGSCGL